MEFKKMKHYSLDYQNADGDPLLVLPFPGKFPPLQVMKEQSRGRSGASGG
jgi:hypothetical protein